MDVVAEYTCPHCGETVEVPIDPTAGASQQFIEDCPICCHPNAIRLDLDEDGRASADA